MLDMPDEIANIFAVITAMHNKHTKLIDLIIDEHVDAYSFIVSAMNFERKTKKLQQHYGVYLMTKQILINTDREWLVRKLSEESIKWIEE